MLDSLLIPDIEEALRDGTASELGDLFRVLHPSETVEVLAPLKAEDLRAVLTALEPQLAAEIFRELPRHSQASAARHLNTDELLGLVGRLYPDDRVDFLKSLPRKRYLEILPGLTQEERDDIQRLAAYPEGSTGSVMTTRYVTLPRDSTVSQALSILRREADRQETIYDSYVVDEEGRLRGRVSLRDLTVADPGDPLDTVLDERVVSVRANENREETIFKMSRYDLQTIPVVNARGVLVGIVTHDDALDVLEQERTEDLERLMAISGPHREESYIHTSIWDHFRHRVFWLVALAAIDLVSGAILQSFQSTLTHLIVLAFYMPMLADTGGNTGSQSSTVVVRALALKEITYKDALRVLGKELAVSLLLALVLGFLAFLRVTFFTSPAYVPQGITVWDIGLAIALALAVQVSSATVIGAALPLGASLLGADPALIASPALTTIVDIMGLAINFGTARLVLGI